MMGFSGWSTAGMFVMMVGIFVLVALAATALVLVVRPVFDRGRRPVTGSTDQIAGGKPPGLGGFADGLEQRPAEAGLTGPDNWQDGASLEGR